MARSPECGEVNNTLNPMSGKKPLQGIRVVKSSLTRYHAAVCQSPQTACLLRAPHIPNNTQNSVASMMEQCFDNVRPEKARRARNQNRLAGGFSRDMQICTPL